MSNLAFEINCYGLPLEDFEREIEKQAKYGYDFQFLAISLLSDAQEQLELGHKEDARKNINRAKYLISKTRPVRGE